MKNTKYQFVIYVIVLVLVFEILGIVFYDMTITSIIITVSIVFIVFALGSYFVALEFYMPILNRLPHSNAKEIAISFDDGPNENTMALLSLLKKHNVKANFFCIGKQLEAFSDAALQIVNDGHLLANHSYSHSGFFALSSYQKVYGELQKTNTLIEGIRHEKNVYFRPPFGVTNPIIARAVANLGMTTVGWSLRSYDTVISNDRLLQKLKTKTKSGDIVLLHDREETLAILDDYFLFAKENGFRFVLISDFENK